MLSEKRDSEGARKMVDVFYLELNRRMRAKLVTSSHQPGYLENRSQIPLQLVPRIEMLCVFVKKKIISKNLSS